jgi:hypothetical protein
MHTTWSSTFQFPCAGLVIPWRRVTRDCVELKLELCFCCSCCLMFVIFTDTSTTSTPSSRRLLSNVGNQRASQCLTDAPVRTCACCKNSRWRTVRWHHQSAKRDPLALRRTTDELIVDAKSREQISGSSNCSDESDGRCETREEVTENFDRALPSGALPSVNVNGSPGDRVATASITLKRKRGRPAKVKGRRGRPSKVIHLESRVL